MSTVRVRPGDVLAAKYKVERVLGTGGMGVVVAARHVDLGQLVAVKLMLKEAMIDPSHAERFLREAKAAVQLKSAHTARVLDVGRVPSADGAADEPFMVMEYLEGRDLDAELQARGPLPPHVAVDYVLQAGEALAEAHALGMVHRDVKLKNLFLTATVDGRPLVKVLDFGLAKTIGSQGDVSLTAPHSVFGSPAYMSPEQMRSAKDVDFRSDIWSVGVCLYELLTGRVPFDAPGVAEICAMVLKDPVIPPSQLARGLPPSLEEAVLRCLEKDPARRFQSIAELAFALQSYTNDTGSAQRIFHVMQTTQKVDLPTLVSIPRATDTGTKTLNAWDSGLPARRTLFKRPQLIGALAGIALAGLFGAGAITVAAKKRSTTTTAIRQPPPESPAPPDPPGITNGGASATPSPAETSHPAAPVVATEATGTAPLPAATARAKTSSPARVPTAKPTTGPAPTSTPKPPAKPKNGPGSGAEYM
jgi:serine/threonine-protein kinase